MALNHTLPHTPVELEPVEYTGHTVPSTVRVCPNMGYTWVHHSTDQSSFSLRLNTHLLRRIPNFQTSDVPYMVAYVSIYHIQIYTAYVPENNIRLLDYWFSPFLYDEIPNQHPRCQPNPACLMANTHRFLVILVFLFHQITAMMQFQARTELATTWSRVVVLRTATKPSMGIHGNGENMSLNQLVFCVEQSQSNKLGSYPLVV